MQLLPDSFAAAPWDDGALKGSAYNVFFGDDCTVLGYNTLYRSLIRLPRKIFDELNDWGGPAETGSWIGSSGDVLEAMQSARFIVDSSIDELDVIKLRYHESLFSSDFLSLTILPTLWCNLDCPYCFEFKKREFMSREVEQSIGDWVRREFASKRVINVSWFGGEPLLAKDTIRRLSARFQGIAEEIGAEYRASVTTNGYYLDEEFARELDGLSIKHVQITFDGDRPEHDKLRKTRSGHGSFDEIFRNVGHLCEHGGACKLTIRVNCCDDNLDTVRTLLDRFPPEIRQRARVFFRWIWANEATHYRKFSSEQEKGEPFRELAALYGYATSIGWRAINPHDSHPGGFCEVDFRDFYQVGPNGDVYLCSHTYQPDHAVGNVQNLDRGAPVLDPGKVGLFAKWYSLNPFADPECVGCILLPTCNGGCRRERFRGKRQCMEEKFSLEAYVRQLLSRKIRDLETQT